MVSEGLAENFATYLYGEDKAGPWVKKTDTKMLNEYIKPIIYGGLDVQGLENLNAYLYGDEMAALQNYPPVGLPYCAGYACGYYLVKHFLKKTGKSIIETTLFFLITDNYYVCTKEILSVFDKGIITRYLKNGANLHQTAAIGENSKRRFLRDMAGVHWGAALFWLSRRPPADPGHSTRKVKLSP